MRADRLIAWNAGILALLAAGLMLYPGFLLGLLRLPEPTFPVLALARTAGCFACVLATVLWQMRSSLASDTFVPMRRALGWAYAATGVLLMGQQYAIWANRPGLLLAFAFLGWGYSYLRAPSVERPQPAVA